MNKNNQIIVRLDDETQEMWLKICSTFKGSTKSDVFRRIIKRLHSSIEENNKIENYG
jgi:hypothetical protein